PAIEASLAEAEGVLTPGGLGPTKDDITKATLMQIFGGTLIHDAETEKNVLEVVAKLGFKINTLTAAQADVPSSCTVIQNTVGTAPIMVFEQRGHILVAMPGVPFETETMLKKAVLPMLVKHFSNDESIEHRTFIVINNTESNLATRLDDFETTIPPYIKLAYLPTPGVIRLRLTGIYRDAQALTDTLDSLSASLTQILGNDIICYEDKTIEEILGALLIRKGFTLATAESCTGGNIAHRITLVPGSSQYFKGGVVAYSNQVKTNQLGVSAGVLEANGAVSQPVVEAMVEGACKALDAQCAVATSGIAGPTGGTPDKPVGTVWMAVKTPAGVQSQCFKFPGSRARVIERATTHALLTLIKSLMR
ncbi:MAG: nicotinamide-nucleotide amidohydrolase family protein, partial [Muribaculaceae bacterium]|nr:nicotinamide-nucleotide amidohydrolase family protein [Muribaculaceae bacterium]